MLPKRLLSVGGNFTLVRLRRAYLPPPLRTANASISAVHVRPATGKVARENPQREKACAMAPVTPLRACAFAATAAMISCPSFHCAFAHSLAFGSVGAIPHSSSAAGHKPKRKMTRAASAAACVPTCAPFEANVALLIAGTQRGFFAAASWVAWFMV